jgi:hypothetical protein
LNSCPDESVIFDEGSEGSEIDKHNAILQIIFGVNPVLPLIILKILVTDKLNLILLKLNSKHNSLYFVVGIIIIIIIIF